MKDDFEVLKDLMARHGFNAAANNIKPYEVRQLREAIRSWENYPACMEVYPTQVRIKVRLPE